VIELPQYLDDYIFAELDGVFQTGQNVDVNLNNDEEANKSYIGTYFPRSFIECYLILKDLYAHKRIKEVIDSKSELKILDIGTGTGGNVIGLLQFLNTINFSKPIEIITVEGNEIAIAYQKKFFNKFSQTFATNFKFRCEKVIFQAETLNLQLDELLNKYNMDFDVITSFKFMSEFYNSDFQNATGLFKTFPDTLSKHLSEKGLFLLLDLVSTGYKRDNRPYTTQIMSDELNEYVRSEDSKLAYILPVCCGLWSDSCTTQGCYIERQFGIKHSKRKYDISKVAYRVMTKKLFARVILSYVDKKNPYQMSYNDWHPRYCKNAIVSDKKNESNLTNAFKLI
jgi:SAM-dependent methyltransferase